MSEQVVALWRYPVKSMGGEELAELALDARGVVGDRQFAVRTAGGKLGSGKTTRRFERIEGLLGFRARVVDGEVEIATPGGRRVHAGDPSVHAVLSEALGQSVELVEESDVSHLDAAPIHLVTHATLDWIRRTASDSDERRLRPNIVTDGTSEPQAGSGWRAGEVTLRITEATERCVMVGLPQAELGPAPDLLRVIAAEQRGCAGVYAEAIEPGIIRRGDFIEIV